jgi:sodium-dependent phosphate transporter
MYTWIIIIGGMFAFFAAMGIGANDVANAFATSVGSKSLTMNQAVVLAAIFETAGAVLMGSHVTNTIRKGIADYKCFEEQPDLLMYGCMWVVFSVGAWLFLASYLEMPVSTTHSCVGGMIGMAVALGGTKCVIWYKPLNNFPYIGGVSGIVISWFISPVFSAIIAVTIFSLLRTFVLRHDFNTKRINWTYPLLIGSTMFINCFFIIYKGATGLGLDKTPLSVAFSISSSIAIVFAIISVPFVPKMKRHIEKTFSGRDIQLTNINSIVQKDIDKNTNTLNITGERELYDIINIHNNAEVFDPKTEYSFKYLQIFTAICDSFSHGANDVANAIGPFAAMWAIYNDHDLNTKNYMDTDAYWILGLGGGGIALGLFLYGYRITHAIGSKLCKITPSRGVAIELSSALVIITGSRLKIPLSTTHCQIGATIGVAALENTKTCGGINYKIIMKTISGWIITCFIVGLTTGILVSQGAYAPAIWNYCPVNHTRLLL